MKIFKLFLLFFRFLCVSAVKAFPSQKAKAAILESRSLAEPCLNLGDHD